MSTSEEVKQNVLAEHHARLLNIEFKWDSDHAWIQELLSGGGGVQTDGQEKQPEQCFFYFLLVLNLFYRLQRHAWGCLLQRKVVLDDNSLRAYDDCLPVLDDR